MQASELATSTALPAAADGYDFQEQRAVVREAYCGALSTMLDEVLGQFLLTDDRSVVLSDAVEFTVFIGILKIAEERNIDVTSRKELMQIFRKLMMLIDRELPMLLMQFVDAKKAEAARG